jgi:hypothetical protein
MHIHLHYINAQTHIFHYYFGTGCVSSFSYIRPVKTIVWISYNSTLCLGLLVAQRDIRYVEFSSHYMLKIQHTLTNLD